MKKIILLCCAAIFAVTASAAVYYVTPTGAGAKSGENWAAAFDNIQAALNAASSGDEVWVAQGDYTPAATLTWKSGVNVYGGFEGNETDKAQRSADALLTVISKAAAARLLAATAALEAPSTWSGFTFQNSTAGGVQMHANCILDNCVVRNNSGTNVVGGGIGADVGESTVITADIVIQNCRLINNSTTSTAGGGAIRAVASASSTGSLVIKNCVIANNYGGNNGGGVSIRLIPTQITNCTFVRNTRGSTWFGAALYLNSCKAVMTGCLFWGNQDGTVANGNGGQRHDFYVETPAAGTIIKNCIVTQEIKVDGSYKTTGTVVYTSTPANVTISDNIVVSRTENTQVRFASPSAAIGYAANSADILNADWSIQSGSVAVNAGSTTEGEYTPADITGRPVKGSARDVGAYEYAEHIAIAAGATVTTDYAVDTYGDVVFESDDASGTGQWAADNTAVTDGVVKLVKTFATGRWYPVGFPFDVAAVSYSGQEAYPCLLRSYSKDLNLFEPAAAIAAGKGYLIQLPEGLGGSVAVTFSSVKNPTIHAAATPDGYDFVANPSLANVASIAGASRYYAFNPSYAGTNDLFGAASSSLDALKPFEAVVVTNATSDLLPSIGTGNSSVKYVTVSADAGVSITSEADLSGRYPAASGESFTLQFTLLDGYALKAVTSGGKVLTPTGSYAVTLEEVTADTAITIATDTIVLPVSVTAEAGYVQWQEAPAESAKYFRDYAFSFTLKDGYHHPYIKVNGASRFVESSADDVYTVTLTDVREAKNIVVSAFAPNVLPVTEDTYVRGNASFQGVNYAAEPVLIVEQANAATYDYRTYLRFDATEWVKNEVYNKAELRLMCEGFETKNYPNRIEVRTVPATLPPLTSMTWTANGENQDTHKGDAIGEPLTVQQNYDKTQPVVFDVSDYILANLKDSVRLQVSAIYVSGTWSDGNIKFYSKENTLNSTYAPQLIFSRVSSAVQVSEDDDNITNLTITAPGGVTGAGTNSQQVSVECDGSLTFTFNALNYKIPLVTVNDTSRTILDETYLSDDVFTFTLHHIVAATSVTIEAIDPVGITVSADAGVNRIAPLGQSPYYVNKGSAFTYTFSLNEGYTNPVVTLGSSTACPLNEPQANEYTVTLGAVDSDTAITVATDTIKLPVSVKLIGGVTLVADAPDTVKYFLGLELAFKLDLGYHKPTVTVNEKPYELSDAQEGIYVVSLSNLREATSIMIRATAEAAADGDVAVIDVADDAFVQDGSANVNTTFNTNTLVVKNDGTGYHRQTYLKFVIPGEVDVNQIGKARISLYLRGANTGIGSVTSWVVYYVDDDAWTETSLTWNNKPIADYEIVRVPTVATGGANVQIPITGKLKAELAKDRTLSVCIDGSNANSKGDVSFYAKESDQPEYLPRLILSSEVDPNDPAWEEPEAPELLDLNIAESIINRIRADKMVRVTATLDNNVDSWIGTMQADGSFSDVDYATQSRSNWAALTHLSRLKEMGLAYTQAGSKYFEDEALYAKIVKGYESWYSKNPYNTMNWWYNRIAHPRDLGEALIAVYPGKKKITNESVFKKLVTRWRSDLGHPDSPADATTAGANKCDIAMHWIYRSCLTRNTEDLAFAAERSFVIVSQVTGEGMQHDWSYRQHGAQLYLAGYGYEFIQLVTRQAFYLVGTPYTLSGEKLDVLSRYVRNTYLNIIRGSRLQPNIFGRSITRENQTSQTSIIPVLEMLKEIDVSNEVAYESAIKRIRKEAPASYALQSTQTHYYRGEYTLQVRPAYTFDVRMASSRMGRSEYDIYENSRGFFLTDGATTVTVDGEEYGTIIPFWDWTKIPGTTLPALDSAQMVRANSYIHNGRSNYAGGVTDGLYGVTAFDMFNNESLYAYNDDEGWGGTPSPQRSRLPALDFGAKKSWFIFDREVVCLGAGIRSGHEEEMQTTINQCRQAGALVVSSGGAEVQPGEGTHRYGHVDWVLNDQVAYFFPDKDSLFLANQTKSGRWRDVNLSFGSETPITGQLFTLWKAHGAKPVNAKYSYIIVPNVSSAAEAKRYDPSHIQVLVNSDSLQVVYNRRLKMYGCAFFGACGFKTSGGLTLEADNSCLVLVKDVDSDTVAVYVSDPQKQGAPINLGIGTPKVQGRKLITYENPAAPHQGKSLEFKVSNATPDFPGRNVALERSGWTVTTSHAGPADATVGGSNPHNIIDGNNVTAFLFVKPGKTYDGITVGGSEPSWFTVDMQQPQEMTYLLYRHRTQGNASAFLRATQASLYGKNEASEDWTPIVEDFSISTEVDEVKIDFPAKASYRYVRLVFTGWDAANGSTMQVSEFNIGTLLPADGSSFEEIPVDTSSALECEVTVEAGAGVTLVSPVGGSPYRVTVGGAFTLTFTLGENYENLQVTVNDVPVTPVIANDGYSVTIPQVTENLTIRLSATTLSTGISGETLSDPNDPVVETTYYNLQGQKLREPTLTGIYVVRRVHASKKVVVKKELVVKH